MIVAVNAIYAIAWRSLKKNSGLQLGLNLWPRDYRCDALPTELWSHWLWEQVKLWVHMLPWKKWVLMICGINHIWTAEMKWKWRNDSRSERNLCHCLKKPEKNSGLQRSLNPWPHDYQRDALLTELWSHWRWEQVNCGFICSRERK